MHRKLFTYFKKAEPIRILFLFILSTLLLNGCTGGKSVTPRYYMLDYPSNLNINISKNLVPVPKSCLVNPVSIYPAFSTNQIALRENTHEIRYFSFNQWAVRPEQSLTLMLNNFILNHNLFKTVGHPSLNNKTDYRLETTVYHIEVVSKEKDYHAGLKLEFRLIDNNSQQVVSEHLADRRVILEERDLNLFAATISNIFIEELEIFAQSILTAF